MNKKIIISIVIGILILFLTLIILGAIGFIPLTLMAVGLGVIVVGTIFVAVLVYFISHFGDFFNKKEKKISHNPQFLDNASVKAVLTRKCDYLQIVNSYPIHFIGAAGSAKSAIKRIHGRGAIKNKEYDVIMDINDVENTLDILEGATEAVVQQAIERLAVNPPERSNRVIRRIDPITGFTTEEEISEISPVVSVEKPKEEQKP